MATARAMVLEEARRFRLHELPVPAPDHDTAILRVEACGVCGTDHEQWSGVLHPGKPLVPGHEVVGVIESTGGSFAARHRVSEGDRVAVEVFQRCGRCDPCRAGVYRRCHEHGLGDMYGFIPLERAPGLWGGYATHLWLAPDAVLLRVPDGLDPVVATLFNPLGAGIRWGVTVPGTKPGDVVAVLGPGVRGLSVAVAAKEAGAALVMVTGRGEADRARLALAPRFGADVVVDVATDEPVMRLLEASGGRLADVVVDVTAAAPEAFVQAMHLARPGGTVVVAGTRGSNTIERFSPDTIVGKELRVIGALGVDDVAYRSALDLLATGRYPFAHLPRRAVDLDGAADLLEALAGAGDDPASRPVHGVIQPC